MGIAPAHLVLKFPSFQTAHRDGRSERSWASATGVQPFSTAGLNLRFNYDGKFGENSRENAFDAKVTVNY